jgi:FtsP/CotA-like multicopper oxidase with cupredoxin domain
MSLFHRKIKDGIGGSAYVSSASGVPPDMRVAMNIASTYRCDLRLVVTVPGREPYAANTHVSADPNRPVLAGMTLPVVVDPRDPQHLQVDLKGVPRPQDALDAQQQADLEAIKTGHLPGGGA